MSDDSALRDALRQARDAFQFVSDGIVFADAEGRIVFANTAAAHLTGSIAGTLDGTDSADLLDAAKHAGLEVRTLPRYSTSGSDEGWLSILRAVPTEEDESELVEQRLIANSDVLELVAALEMGAQLDDTIDSLCSAIAKLPGIDGAMILMLPPSGDAIHKAHAGRARVPYKRDQRIPLKDSELLIDMTLAGPWAVSTNSASAWRLFGTYALAMRVGGIHATAYAPMRVGGKLLGVLAVASMERNGIRALEARLDTLSQLATLAGTMIHNQSSEFGRQEAARHTVRDCIDAQRFHAVFQPIVRLSDRSVFAYEALTRFHDGQAPDKHFQIAQSVGLGRELEEAAVRLALASCDGLPADMPVTVNFSPDVLAEIAGSDLLQHPPRPITIEVTEHSRIEDYRKLLDALARAPHLQLSVDDAGAGFASLRHILELQPDFVKLDIGLVRDVHLDPARAALVAGMCHFARTTGKVLIAEGVECVEEADALRELGVELAQGYYFAVPALAETFRNA